MILSSFCPMCFKTRIGEGNAERVRLDSPRIDKDQFRHSKKGNGIPVLDLDYPGDICQHCETCAVRCLVCGQAVLEGGSPEYRVFRKVLEQGDTQANKAPKTLQAFDQIRTREKVRAALASHQAVLVGSWAMPVHRRCAQARACGCMVPLAAESCPCEKPRFCAMDDEPDEPMQALAPRPTRTVAPVQHAPREKGLGAEGTLGRAIAGWGGAKGAVLTVSIDVVREPIETDCMLPAKKPKPAPRPAPKPVPQGVRRLDAWVQPREAPVAAGLLRPVGTFSVREHLRAFDIERHGYALTKDGLSYRFPDGRFVRVSAGVNTLDDGGLLTPSANNEPQTAAESGSV